MGDLGDMGQKASWTDKDWMADLIKGFKNDMDVASSKSVRESVSMTGTASHSPPTSNTP